MTNQGPASLPRLGSPGTPSIQFSATAGSIITVVTGAGAKKI